MGHTLDLPEIDTLMDIAFLFQSVRDLKVMSQRFLQLLGRLIPYEKAVVLLYQEDQRSYAALRGGAVRRRDAPGLSDDLLPAGLPGLAALPK